MSIIWLPEDTDLTFMCMYSLLINRNNNNMLCYIVLMLCQDGCLRRLCLIGCSWPGTESAGGRAGVL